MVKPAFFASLTETGLLAFGVLKLETIFRTGFFAERALLQRWPAHRTIELKTAAADFAVAFAQLVFVDGHEFETIAHLQSFGKDDVSPAILDERGRAR
jgi:adenylate kinase